MSQYWNDWHVKRGKAWPTCWWIMVDKLKTARHFWCVIRSSQNKFRSCLRLRTPVIVVSSIKNNNNVVSPDEFDVNVEDAIITIYFQSKPQSLCDTNYYFYLVFKINGVVSFSSAFLNVVQKYTKKTSNSPDSRNVLICYLWLFKQKIWFWNKIRCRLLDTDFGSLENIRQVVFCWI